MLLPPKQGLEARKLEGPLQTKTDSEIVLILVSD